MNIIPRHHWKEREREEIFIITSHSQQALPLSLQGTSLQLWRTGMATHGGTLCLFVYLAFYANQYPRNNQQQATFSWTKKKTLSHSLGLFLLCRPIVCVMSDPSSFSWVFPLSRRKRHTFPLLSTTPSTRVTPSSRQSSWLPGEALPSPLQPPLQSILIRLTIVTRRLERKIIIGIPKRLPTDVDWRKQACTKNTCYHGGEACCSFPTCDIPVPSPLLLIWRIMTVWPAGTAFPYGVIHVDAWYSFLRSDLLSYLLQYLE